MNLQEKFEKGREAKTYQRIDAEYKVNVYLGYNDEGQMSLVIIEKGVLKKVRSSSVIKVKMYRRKEEENILLSFDLLDNTYMPMFLTFSKDMILIAEKAGREMAISNAVSRWKYWMQMFSRKKSDLLRDEQIKGLLGELLELKGFFIPKYGASLAVGGWMGPYLGHKDYEIGTTWHEIKAVNENALQVRISSLEQLESDEDGHLHVVRLEKTNDVNKLAVNLNNTVLSIIDKIEELEVLDLFREKLECAGYFSCPEYDSYNYIYKGTQKYIVTEGFPRLRRCEISPAVGNAEYTLILSNLGEYLEN